ncbi:MAG TPA: DUF2283 domain-containing protein [Anaerolineae bacterium]|nr:DUF2283 domain-containing protein [Anaerolineae bacterium]
MRLKVDRENDALCFGLDESPVVESEEVQPGVILDLNAEGKLVCDWKSRREGLRPVVHLRRRGPEPVGAGRQLAAGPLPCPSWSV